jgi:hypothetical protein
MLGRIFKNADTKRTIPCHHATARVAVRISPDQEVLRDALVLVHDANSTSKTVCRVCKSCSHRSLLRLYHSLYHRLYRYLVSAHDSFSSTRRPAPDSLGGVHNDVIRVSFRRKSVAHRVSRNSNTCGFLDHNGKLGP